MAHPFYIPPPSHRQQSRLVSCGLGANQDRERIGKRGGQDRHIEGAEEGAVAIGVAGITVHNLSPCQGPLGLGLGAPQGLRVGGGEAAGIVTGVSAVH